MGSLKFRVLILLIAFASMSSCESPWNNPYPTKQTNQNVYYYAYRTRPKHLDPARAYYSHELRMLANVYEPPLDYHYLRRPYELVALTATAIPDPVYFDKDGKVLPGDPPADLVATAQYTVRIKPGVKYQNHPCFAKGVDGSPFYKDVSDKQVRGFEHIEDFRQVGTREVHAADYVNEICRLADPRLNSPIYSTMKQYILGMGEFRQALEARLDKVRDGWSKQFGDGFNDKQHEQANPIVFDYLSIPFEGLEVIDARTYRITLKQKYPQMRYWLAMNFFCAMPPEAAAFYGEPAIVARDITIDRFPVGTGPFKIDRNTSELELIMTRNVNFHDDFYPTDGEDGDRKAGLLEDAGKKLPFLDRIVWKYEKESLPRWNKFFQGYYDHYQKMGSGTFQQAVELVEGQTSISKSMEEKGIWLSRAVDFTTWEFAFNMLDKTVGGLEPKKQKLRQAIAIAIDSEEYIRIFRTERAVSSHGPIPDGIFGAIDTTKDHNPFVWERNDKGELKRKSIEEAKRLLAEAGYENGIGADGQPLTISFDNALTNPGDQIMILWLQKQFAKLGIRLESKTTDHGTYRDKLLNGNFQVALRGWTLDYPDPENFLFLLYGPNGRAEFDGENVANYASPKVDELFVKMSSMNNGPPRKAVIDELVHEVQKDGPWVFLYHPEEYILVHGWAKNVKTSLTTRNVMKYRRIDTASRTAKRSEWNRPILWPVISVVVLLVIIALPAVRTVSRK